MKPIGSTLWAIAEGYIPPAGTQGSRELESHETVCLLNAGPTAADVEITIYFTDRDPAGPYRIRIEPRRARHLRFNELRDPQVPRGTTYSSVICSSAPIVVQHTRLDSRQSENALLSTIAWSDG